MGSECSAVEVKRSVDYPLGNMAQSIEEKEEEEEEEERRTGQEESIT